MSSRYVPKVRNREAPHFKGLREIMHRWKVMLFSGKLPFDHPTPRRIGKGGKERKKESSEQKKRRDPTIELREEGLGEAADEEAEEDVDGDAEEGESQPSVLWRVSCQTVPRPKVGVRVHQWSKESIPQELSGAGSRVRPCSLETDCCTGTEMSLPDLHDFEIFYMFSKTWKYRAGAH